VIKPVEHSRLCSLFFHIQDDSPKNAKKEKKKDKEKKKSKA